MFTPKPECGDGCSSMDVKKIAWNYTHTQLQVKLEKSESDSRTCLCQCSCCDMVSFYRTLPPGETWWRLYRISVYCLLQVHMNLQLSQSRKANKKRSLSCQISFTPFKMDIWSNQGWSPPILMLMVPVKSPRTWDKPGQHQHLT